MRRVTVLRKAAGASQSNPTGAAGIGVRFTKAAKGPCKITSIAPGGPVAQTKSVNVDDFIHEVNGRTVSVLSVAEVVQLILGQDGSWLTLTISEHEDPYRQQKYESMSKQLSPPQGADGSSSNSRSWFVTPSPSSRSRNLQQQLHPSQQQTQQMQARHQQQQQQSPPQQDQQQNCAQKNSPSKSYSLMGRRPLPMSPVDQNGGGLDNSTSVVTVSEDREKDTKFKDLVYGTPGRSLDMRSSLRSAEQAGSRQSKSIQYAIDLHASQHGNTRERLDGMYREGMSNGTLKNNHKNGVSRESLDTAKPTRDEKNSFQRAGSYGRDQSNSQTGNTSSLSSLSTSFTYRTPNEKIRQKVDEKYKVGELEQAQERTTSQGLATTEGSTTNSTALNSASNSRLSIPLHIVQPMASPASPIRTQGTPIEKIATAPPSSDSPLGGRPIPKIGAEGSAFNKVFSPRRTLREMRMPEGISLARTDSESNKYSVSVRESNGLSSSTDKEYRIEVSMGGVRQTEKDIVKTVSECLELHAVLTKQYLPLPSSAADPGYTLNIDSLQKLLTSVLRHALFAKNPAVQIFFHPVRIHELDEDGCRKEFNGKSECDRMDKHVDMLRQQLMKAQQQIETHEANWRDHLKKIEDIEQVAIRERTALRDRNEELEKEVQLLSKALLEEQKKHGQHPPIRDSGMSAESQGYGENSSRPVLSVRRNLQLDANSSPAAAATNYKQGMPSANTSTSKRPLASPAIEISANPKIGPPGVPKLNLERTRQFQGNVGAPSLLSSSKTQCSPGQRSVQRSVNLASATVSSSSVQNTARVHRPMEMENTHSVHAHMPVVRGLQVDSAQNTPRTPRVTSANEVASKGHVPSPASGKHVGGNVFSGHAVGRTSIQFSPGYQVVRSPYVNNEMVM